MPGRHGQIDKKRTRCVLPVLPGDTRLDPQAVKTLLAGKDKAEELAGSVSGTVLPVSYDKRLELIAVQAVMESCPQMLGGRLWGGGRGCEGWGMAGYSADLKALIDSQAGMLARWQAREHDVPDHALRDLLRGGHWTVRSPGVYATFAGLLSRWAELWAALLHCSHRPRRRPGVHHLPDAVLSHETAGELYGFAESHLIHVTIPSGRRRPKDLPGVRVHFSSHLDRTRHPALWPPRTRVDDTVLDLTQSANDAKTAIDWLDRACAHHLTTPAHLSRALSARARARHRPDLTQALTAPAHDLLETRYRQLVERPHNLPPATRRPGRTRELTYDQYATKVHLNDQNPKPPPTTPNGQPPETPRPVRRPPNPSAQRHEAARPELRPSDLARPVRRLPDPVGQEAETPRPVQRPHLWEGHRDTAFLAHVDARENGAVLSYDRADVATRPCVIATDLAIAIREGGWQGTAQACGRPGCPVAPAREAQAC